MKKTTKLWLLVATGLVIVGGLVFAGAMTIAEWDFSLLSTSDYVTNEYGITEVYQNISVTTDTADVVVVPSADAGTTVICYEQEKVRHTVTVEDDTLKILVQDTRKWYEHIGIHFETPIITISIPAKEYGKLLVTSSTGNVEVAKDFSFSEMEILGDTGAVINFAGAERMRIGTATGSIRVENVNAGSLDLAVSTGKVTVKNVTCEKDLKVNVSTGKTELTGIRCVNLVSNGDTGALEMADVVATGAFSIQRDTGAVRLDACDAAEISIETDTGDVRGKLLTPKIFKVQTDTGKVTVPRTMEGGICEVKTDTGDIWLQIVE